MVIQFVWDQKGLLILTLVHEIDHYNNWMDAVDGVSYWNQPREISARAAEAKYMRSPMAREPLITGKTIKEDKEREKEQALAEQEREKEQDRQRERNKSYEKIQADRESVANIFNSYSTTNSPATTPETNSDKDSQNNYTENSSQEIDLTNSSQSWGGLFGVFGAVVGAW